MLREQKFKTKVIAESQNPIKYDKILYEYFEAGEGREHCAYDDKTKKTVKELKAKKQKLLGNITVGIGFNMEFGDEDWDFAFRNVPKGKKPHFKKVKKGEDCLTDSQIDVLLRGCIEKRRRKLKRKCLFRFEWDHLEPNEKLAIEDLYFNGGEGLVGITTRKDKEGNKIPTNFCTNLKQYIKAKKEGDMELAKLHLEVSLWEVRYNSNIYQKGHVLYQGMQNRRASQTFMLNTYDIPILEKRNADFLKKEIDALQKKKKSRE